MSANQATSRMSQSKPLELVVLGMCAGAALSSVSCILLRYQQKSPDAPLHMGFIHYDEIVVPLHLRSPILNLLREYPKNLHAMHKVQQLLGHLYTSTLNEFCEKYEKISVDSIDLIATQADSIPAVVLPLTGASRSSETNVPLQSWTTAMNGETDITTITTVPTTRRPANRRDPWAEPSIDCLLLEHPTKFRVCLTVNDITHLSIIPPSSFTTTHAPSNIDIGPGTVFIDYAMRYSTSNQIEHDQHGAYAARGTVNHNIVDRFLKVHDYSRRSPSMSIAIEMFGHHEAQNLIDECLFLGMTDHDIIATITRVTAENMVRQYRKLMDSIFPDQQVDEMFICGPGAQNSSIVDYLEDVLPGGIITKPLDDIGIPGNAKDALRCAQLGLEIMLRHASLTDEELEAEQRQTMPGSLAKGKTWEATCEKVVRFSQGRELPSVPRIVVARDDLSR